MFSTLTVNDFVEGCEVVAADTRELSGRVVSKNSDWVFVRFGNHLPEPCDPRNLGIKGINTDYDFVYRGQYGE